MVSPIHVKSEIAPLREVLIHRPGNELLNLTPSMLHELLFDDIPFLPQAQKEHDAFTQIMRDAGVKVTELLDLVAEALEAHPEEKESFLRTFISDAQVREPYYQDLLYDYLANIEDCRMMVAKTMQGVTVKELEKSHSRRSLSDYVGQHSLFLLSPMPNLYFMRDNLATLGTGVVIPRMYSFTRSRETIYTQTVLRLHPRFAGEVEEYFGRGQDFSIEGGDILNLSEEVVAVGLSQRTTPEAVEELAKQLFHQHETGVKKVVAIRIPNSRAFMHLDTVFTQIDEDAFTYHPGMLTNIRFFILERKEEGYTITEFDETLEEMLKRLLGKERIRLFPCARGDLIAAEREQWNDGSNTLALAPGEILTYDRNVETNAMLREAGFIVHEMPSYELSRGRGGPRCMSMPLYRG